jgi:LysR family transcriptional regulator, transcriptional activator of the cysJI operon
MSRERLDLAQLETLLALVESGNFGKAAKSVGLAQSTVSEQLRRLEAALGTPLIIRGRRGCRPTAAALQLLPYAKSLLRLEQRVVEAVGERALRLGACSNVGIYMLPRLLRDFQTAGGKPPEVMIGSNPQTVRQLETAELDAALLEWWDEREGFRWQPWCSEPLVVIVAPSHPLSGAPALSRGDLARLPLIGGEDGTGTGRLLRSYFGDRPLPRISMRLGSTEAVKRAVAAGLGASLVLACTIEEEVRDGRLRAIPLRDHPLRKSLLLVWRNDLPADVPLLRFLADVHRARVRHITK